MHNYIYDYYQKIQDGSIVVGRWILLWYEYIVKGLEKGLFYFDAKKANKAIRFIETFCRHHEGALAPSLVKLELWQKAFVSVVFGVVDKSGCRQFREVVCIVARKNGKTLFAAAIAEYCTFLDGEYGARIYFAAPKLEQAALCYDAYYQMIDKDEELSRLAKKRRSDIYIAESNSSAKPLAFSAKKSDGLNISLCVADEIASWPGEQGLKFYEVIKSSFGARKQPLLLSISTSGYINEGIYDELIKRCTRLLLGDSKESRLAPFLYMIDDIEKWNDINELRKSNPNLGVSVSVDYLLEEIAVAEPVQKGRVYDKILQHQAKQQPGLAVCPGCGKSKRRSSGAGGISRLLLCRRHRPIQDNRPYSLHSGDRKGRDALCVCQIFSACRAHRGGHGTGWNSLSSLYTARLSCTVGR